MAFIFWNIMWHSLVASYQLPTYTTLTAQKNKGIIYTAVDTKSHRFMAYYLTGVISEVIPSQKCDVTRCNMYFSYLNVFLRI